MAGDPAGPGIRFGGLSVDCADPQALVGFYRRLLGGEILWQSAGSVGIRVPGVVLALQRVPGYRPPAWPGTAIVHLDLIAPGGLDAAAAQAVALGAVLAADQPDPRWRVLLDPAGHPFCITAIAPPDDPLSA
jgi:hypothetical protein